MKLSPEQLYIYTLVLRNYLQVCEHIGLSEVDALKPGAGKWIVDYIKQYQTSVGIIKTMTMTQNPIQDVDSKEDTQLPPL